MTASAADPKTLPDYLREGLDIVFVGINPGASSVVAGHYFSGRFNRFWPALNLSGIAGAQPLGPPDDVRMNDLGFGLTDVVKRPSRVASELRAADYRRWAPLARERLIAARPLVICFNGITGYKHFLRYAEGLDVAPALGEQERPLGDSVVFVAPSPSPANASYSLEDIAEWYRRLGAVRDRLKGARGAR